MSNEEEDENSRRMSLEDLRVIDAMIRRMSRHWRRDDSRADDEISALREAADSVRRWVQ